MHHPKDRIAHTTAFGKPVVEHWLYIKEGNVLFNHALNTFFVLSYSIEHMIQDHSDDEKGNPLPVLYGLLVPISNDIFYMHHPTNRTPHTTTVVTRVVEHWLERAVAEWVRHDGSPPSSEYKHVHNCNGRATTTRTVHSPRSVV